MFFFFSKIRSFLLKARHCLRLWIFHPLFLCVLFQRIYQLFDIIHVCHPLLHPSPQPHPYPLPPSIFPTPHSYHISYPHHSSPIHIAYSQLHVGVVVEGFQAHPWKSSSLHFQLILHWVVIIKPPPPDHRYSKKMYYKILINTVFCIFNDGCFHYF